MVSADKQQKGVIGCLSAIVTKESNYQIPAMKVILFICELEQFSNSVSMLLIDHIMEHIILQIA